MNLSPTARSRSLRESTVRITSGLKVLLKVKFTTAPQLVAAAVAARVLPFGHTHYATLQQYYLLENFKIYIIL